MKYKCVEARSGKELSERVQKYLDDGWKIHGQQSLSNCESWGHFKKQGEYTVFTQAIIKGESNE